MKKFQFLLLDAGPIIKLFELGIWDTFIKKCDITISKIVADEAKWASQEFQDISIDLEHYKEQIKIIDVEFSVRWLKPSMTSLSCCIKPISTMVKKKHLPFSVIRLKNG